MKAYNVPKNKYSDDWWTPLEVVQSLGPFDLDPCGNKSHPTAEVIYEDSGLEKEWSGRVWMNPPYSKVATWVDKFIKHRHGVALLFARTDTKWCQNLLEQADHVFLVRGRVSFLKSGVKQKGNGGAPSALFYFGDYVQPSWRGVKIK